MNRILVIVLVVALFAGGYMLYLQHTTGSAFGSGDVTSHDLGSTEKSRMDSGAVDLDGKPITDVAQTAPHADVTGGINADSTTASPASTPAPIPAPTALSQQRAAGPGSSSAAVPVTDTIAPNPPNGAVFAGTGKYQWYRQGNLTWRVDSGSGRTCIAFATMDEWQKPLVYTHGCGNA